MTALNAWIRGTYLHLCKLPILVKKYVEIPLAFKVLQASPRERFGRAVRDDGKHDVEVLEVLLDGGDLVQRLGFRFGVCGERASAAARCRSPSHDRTFLVHLVNAVPIHLEPFPPASDLPLRNDNVLPVKLAALRLLLCNLLGRLSRLCEGVALLPVRLRRRRVDNPGLDLRRRRWSYRVLEVDLGGRRRGRGREVAVVVGRVVLEALPTEAHVLVAEIDALLEGRIQGLELFRNVIRRVRWQGK